MDLCFFFNDTATTEIYTLSLHDALPIFTGARSSEARLEPGSDPRHRRPRRVNLRRCAPPCRSRRPPLSARRRSEEHTSELQSRQYLVCRLLLEKKKQHKNSRLYTPHQRT